MLYFLLQQIEACPGIFLRVVSALAPHLYFSPAPLLREPREAGLQGPAARVVVQEGGVDAVGVRELERFEVGFEGVPEEDGGWRG